MALPKLAGSKLLTQANRYRSRARRTMHWRWRATIRHGPLPETGTTTACFDYLLIAAANTGHRPD